MIDSTAVSSVRAVYPRGIRANMMKETPGSTESAGKTVGKVQKPSGQDIKINMDKDMHGALAKLREDMREFTFGVLRPKTGLVGEKTYETSFSQAMENLSKEYKGALTGFHNKINGFAFGILRPEDKIVGAKTYDSSHSMTMDNLSKEYIGAAAGIKDTLREYVKAARESTGPLVKMVEPLKILQHDFMDTAAADTAQDTQHVDMKV